MAGKSFDLERDLPRIGQRAELLASWHMRFNGYFPISGFIVHDAGVVMQPGGQITEADILAIRLPHTEEAIKAPEGLIRVQADPHLDVRRGITDFAICEVSSLACKFNQLKDDGNVDEEFLKYCLRRLGHWKPADVTALAHKLSVKKAIGPTKGTRTRLLSFGATRANGLTGIKQITFECVLTYMATPLFGCYNDQLGVAGRLIVSDHQQWHPLICQVYKRLRGHQLPQQSPTEVAQWM